MLALYYKQLMQSLKSPSKKNAPKNLTNRIIFSIVIVLIKPKY